MSDIYQYLRDALLASDRFDGVQTIDGLESVLVHLPSGEQYLIRVTEIPTR